MPLIRKKDSFVWSFDVCKFKVHKCVTYRVGIDSISFSHIQFTSVQSLSCVQLFATPWTAARQASLSIANSQSLLRLMSIESVMPSNHLILCHTLLLCLQSFSASGSFQMSQLFAWGGQSIGVSASTSVLPTLVWGKVWWNHVLGYISPFICSEKLSLISSLNELLIFLLLFLELQIWGFFKIVIKMLKRVC